MAGQFFIALCPVVFALAVLAVEPAPADVLSFVNPLIGTNNGGNVFAGATLPFGMAKAVADVDGQNNAGFATDGSNVTGFSHLHDSGTGGQPSMGNFPLFPQFCPGDNLDNCKLSKADRAIHYVGDSVKATPGYFALSLVNGIDAEMTVAQHTALYRFSFPPSSIGGAKGGGTGQNPFILLDLTDLQDSRLNASINVEDHGRMKGQGTFLPSFGTGSYTSYFCVDFAGLSVRETGIFSNSRAATQPKSFSVPHGVNLFYFQAGGFVMFNPSDNNELKARVGLSFISADQACDNAATEIPGSNWDFDGVRRNAESSWRQKLSGIKVDAGGTSEDLQVSFWSGVYRSMISPQDYTGENPLWSSGEPYFDSFYCLWDSFRSQFPLLAILDEQTLARMIRSLLDTYRHLGWLPDCRMSFCKGFTQVGSNADVVIADAYVKGVSGHGIDWGIAYEALTNDAENEPFDWSVQGRGGLTSWKSLNYIPALDFDYIGFGVNSHSISRTLEYSYNDFCISELARGLNRDHEKYLKRAGNWQNLFKADQTSVINGTDTGFVGFLQPRFSNGTWGFQDPILCSPLDTFCSLTLNPQETYESSIWEYQFFVPHDTAALINLLGGPPAFVSRLDFLHESGLIDIGNEPAFLALFLYHYAGRPALSAKRAHSYVPSFFNSSNTGLPGNDDSGAMGSFVAFVMMGLFPNAGQNVYLISPPFFKSLSFSHPVTKKTATIRNVNFDPTYRNIFIQNATLDGVPYTKTWIEHSFFTEGKILELTLGSTESDWGTKPKDLPPSLPAGTMYLPT